MLLFKFHLFSRAVGREGHCKQTSQACVGSARSLSCTGFAPAHGVCAFMVYISQALGCSARNYLRRALGCVHLPGLSYSGSGSQVLPKGADLVGPAFLPFSGLSSSGDQVPEERITPRWAVRLITPLLPATRFSGCTVGAPSQVCPVSLLGS